MRTIKISIEADDIVSLEAVALSSLLLALNCSFIECVQTNVPLDAFRVYGTVFVNEEEAKRVLTFIKTLKEDNNDQT